MRAIPFASALILLAAGCGADVTTNKAAGAAAAVGFGVGAAAINRAATGDCWASCRHGQVCDRDSGMCIPLEPSARPRASASARAPEPPNEQASVTEAAPIADPCRGLCFSGERCEIVRGVADCVLVDAGAIPSP